jgi:hypothetical protein
MTTTAGKTRRVRVKRTIKVGADSYKIGRKATRSVTKNAEGTSKTVSLAKRGGGAIVKTLTKSADAKNLKIGRYARNHATANADGSTTYAKKGGGTVSLTKSVTGTPKKKNGTTSGSAGQGTTNTNTGSGATDDQYGNS